MKRYTIDQLRTLFLDFLQDQMIDREPANLYAPINYIMDLGGKRLRPIASLMAYNLFNEDVSKCLPFAYAIEMFHNFTLAHDDVMDNADVRRGKSSMHVKYSLNSAILSGDAMLIESYQHILNSVDDLSVKDKLMKLFTNTALEICEGQQYDMDFEQRKDVDLAEYLLMIKLKTAVLLASSLKGGALLAGASDKEAGHLYSFGLNVGLAFQIRDDVLDLYSDQAHFGKKKGGDIIQGKKSYLYLKAIEMLDEQKGADLIELYESDMIEDEDKISRVKEYFDDLAVRDEAILLMNELTENAMDHLQKLQVEKEMKQELIDLADHLLKRNN